MGKKVFSVLWPPGICLPYFSLTTPFVTHLGTWDMARVLILSQAIRLIFGKG